MLPRRYGNGPQGRVFEMRGIANHVENIYWQSEKVLTGNDMVI